MKKRFIILIDFSPYSENLLRYAYYWSKKVNAELVLVHYTFVVAPALADDASKREITDIINREAYEKLKVSRKRYYRKKRKSDTLFLKKNYSFLFLCCFMNLLTT